MRKPAPRAPGDGTQRRPFLGAVLGTLLVLLVGLVAPFSPSWSAPTLSTATALNGADFNPGLIVSDDVFFNNGSMSVAEIQDFLNAKGPGSCNNCLRQYRASTYARAADPQRCVNALQAKSNVSAAQIIYDVAQACEINPQVLLVMLQKETSLVTLSAPEDWRYQRAMGYACPDSAPCDTAYYGLFIQLYSAASQLNYYGTPGSSFTWYPVGAVTAVRYHPNSACGASAVLIQNRATAALYYYTPYQPNSAALANLHGTGDSCSSYGNRNFWVFFNEWFGSSVTTVPADAINARYVDLGGATGPLGAVVDAPSCTGASECTWTYESGAIAWTKWGGAVATYGAIGEAWLADPAAFGRPLFPATDITDPNGDGVAQTFELGVVHSSASGTFLVPNGLMSAYSSRGWLRGTLGWPTSASTCGGPAGWCVQTFQGGIGTTRAGVGSFLPTDIGDAYLASGAQSGPLGFPTSSLTTITDPNGDGVVLAFQGGIIHASSYGAYSVPNNIMPLYSAYGWLRGKLGWPTGDYACGAASCGQAFVGGIIRTAANGTGAAIVPPVDPAIEPAFLAAGGETGTLGYPIAPATAVTDRHGNGVVQAFQGGIVHAGPPGAFLVPSAIMPAYSAAGWLRGSLGWPTAAAVCDDTGCSQDFAGGTILVPTGKKGFVVAPIVDAAIRDLYDTSGGASGPLGYPSAPQFTVTDKHGNGVAQVFQNGIVHSSSAGAFLVPSAIMPAYSAAGWLRGSLGWPTAAAVCDDTGCSQDFAGGTILVPTGKKGFVVAPIVDAAIRDLYDTSGGASGPLGYPSAPQFTVTDKHGNGVAQVFQNGIVHSSSAGAFLVPSAIMPAYSAAGWLRGSLGWPTAAAVCDDTGCSQDFAGGTILVPTGKKGFVVAPIVDAAIRDLYDTSGGASGPLGYPSAPQFTVTDKHGNGVAQVFQNGIVHSSSAGAFLVPSAIMPAYSAAGWLRGSLGWPTAAAVCDDTGCSQQFQGGVIDTHP